MISAEDFEEELVRFLHNSSVVDRSLSCLDGLLGMPSEGLLMRVLEKKYGERDSLYLYGAHVLVMETRKEIGNGRNHN